MQDLSVSDVHELTTFTVLEQEFCLDIMAVREIRGWVAATPLPHTPAYVKGVMNLRGAVLPVIDLAARLGLTPCTPTSRHVVIVVKCGERSVGLLVDAVCDILTVASAQVQAAPEISNEGMKGFVRGVIAVDDRMITWIDLERTLSVQQEAA